MLRRTRAGLALALVVSVTLVLQRTLFAGAPGQVNFQARLTDQTGKPLADQNVPQVTFKLFSDSTLSHQVWTETQINVPVSRGIVSVQLGAATPLAPTLFADGGTKYLQITVNSDPPLSPAVQFVSVPYALCAATLNGKTDTQIGGTWSGGGTISTDTTFQNVTLFGNNANFRGVNGYWHMQGGFVWDASQNAQWQGSVALNNFQLTGSLGGTLSVNDLTANGTKQFRIVDPSDSSSYISYNSVESPKVMLHDYGNGQLANGRATVSLDPTFSRVTEDVLRATVTATGDCKGLFVASVAADRSSFVVQECQGGTSSVQFNWTAWAIRKGYLSQPVVTPVQ